MLPVCVCTQQVIVKEAYSYIPLPRAQTKIECLLSGIYCTNMAFKPTEVS